MSKIHSKVSFIKLAALSTIGLGIAFVLIQGLLSIQAIFSSQSQPEKSVDPITIQQQNIKKAHDLILSQTVVIETQ